MNLKKHAYLTKDGLEYRESGNWIVEPIWINDLSTADRLFTRLWSANRIIWILDRELAMTIGQALNVDSERYEVQRNENQDESFAMAERNSFRPKGADDWASLLFPEKAAQWVMDKAEPWGSRYKGVDVVESALVNLQNFFHRSFCYPPGRLNAYLLEESRERANAAVEYKRKPAGYDLFTAPRIHVADWNRTRPLKDSEKKMRYVHSFDKRAMYLQAIGIPMAIGRYRHITNPKWDYNTIDKPGLWRVDTRIPDGMNLPYPPNIGEWVTTPTLHQMLEFGLVENVPEAYITDESHKLFPTYYAHINRALALAEETGGSVGNVMKDCVKALYTQGIGYLRASHAKDEWFYRPDWWATIVAESAARMFRDAFKVYSELGLIPAASHVDCLYYVSDSESTPIHSILSSKYRFKGTAELTPEMVSALDSGAGSGEFAGLVKAGIAKFSH